MKRLSLYLFLILFTLQAPSWADDIRDFQIEGMSIGDSLLDHFSRKEIKKNKGKTKFKNNKFTEQQIKSLDFEFYDHLLIYYKTTDKLKTIYSISGKKFYEKNIEDCYSEKKEIINELSGLFPDTKIIDIEKKPHDHDKTGESTKDNYRFVFDSKDYVYVACYDWSEATGYRDHLSVGMVYDEFDHWIYNEAY
jgi:hypothetical protein